jgi:hypothetical protein
MSEFIMLFRGGDSRTVNNTPEAFQAHMDRWGQWIGGLAEQGKMLGAQPLHPAGKTVKGTKAVVTDGPYMEGKEMVGGYLILKADTMEEAIEASKGCPILEFDDGNVEIREIQQMSMPS